MIKSLPVFSGWVVCYHELTWYTTVDPSVWLLHIFGKKMNIYNIWKIIIWLCLIPVIICVCFLSWNISLPHICGTRGRWVNLSPPSAAYMRQWIGSALVQIMAGRLFGTKPLPEPMLAYCQLDSWEQISVNFESELYHFHSRKFIWKCRLPKWRPFCPRGVKPWIISELRQ